MGHCGRPRRHVRSRFHFGIRAFYLFTDIDTDVDSNAHCYTYCDADPSANFDPDGDGDINHPTSSSANHRTHVYTCQ